MKLYWECCYDGRKCKSVLVNVENGNVKEPKFLKGRHYWEICENCPQNHSMSGHCRGRLVGDFRLEQASQ